MTENQCCRITYDMDINNIGSLKEMCPDCGQEMEIFRYSRTSTAFWKCPFCLKFGKVVDFTK